MNIKKYNDIRLALEVIVNEKAHVDELAMLKTVLTEATDVEGNIKIIIERNKQQLTIPASLLVDFVNTRKTEKEDEVEALVDKVSLT